MDNLSIPYRILRHDKVVTMEDVRNVTGISYDLMAKTLVVKVRDLLYQVVLLGCERLDKHKLAAYLDVKKSDIELLAKEVIEQTIGIQVGAIPPFGLGLPVVIDQRIATLDIVYCGFGSVNTSLEIQAADLVRVSHGKVADITV